MPGRVQPVKVEMGIELSAQVGKAMPALIEAVIKKLKDWGAQAREKAGCA